MNLSRRLARLLSVTVLALPLASAQAAEPLSPAKARALASDLYIYGYPMVLMETTMQQQTNVPDATSVPMRAPVNQFAHFRTFPGAESRDVVRYNFDTLYSFAWVDVSKEPIVLTVPDSGGRYYLVPSLDMWTDVFSVPGTRTTGNTGGNFAMVPRGWQGQLPAGVTRVETPTSMTWITGRTQTNGPADFPNVHKIQDGFKLTPLSRWGKPEVKAAPARVDASIDAKTPPLVQVGKLDGVTMLTRLAELMKKNPPHASDYPTLMRAAAIGLAPGLSFDASKLDPATIEAINAGAQDAKARLQKRLRDFGTRVNGWRVLTEGIGSYGSNYEQRAVIALAGLGANLPEDSIYPTTFVDADGKPFSADKSYVLHFDKDKLPPADAFWSVTLYDTQGFQVANAINRFAIGDRDALQFNADGSLDLYIQGKPPGSGRDSNWLPAPQNGNFSLTMRVYLPRAEAFTGGWVPPGVKRMTEAL
ncbi:MULTISPECIES: DUF1254 domain-containing protein [unclassified Variovorax]|uniref:DUF1254 domain-containing protein n=1 Tax=unclassified Variovorax TaxID=663243 RepID=UPI00210D6433|nr:MULTISPECIES: DUF1254 domain-containing protein [unclassified Variovorax]